MPRTALIALSALAVATAAQAQVPTERATTPPRNGPPLALAEEAVHTAISTCAAQGYQVSAVVVESHGSIIALLSGDGSSYRTAELALAKAATTMKYKVASGEIATRAATDTALVAELKADPKIQAAHIGALPIVVGGQMIGAIAASGAVGGEHDEACAKAGLDKIASRLK